MGSQPSGKNINPQFPIRINNGTHNRQLQLIKHDTEVDTNDQTIIFDIMSKHCVFSILNNEERKLCLTFFKKQIFSKSSYVYRQHDIPQYVYLIGFGQISLERDCVLIKVMNRYEYFGQQTICFDSFRSESIRVMSQKAVLYLINKIDFNKIIKKAMMRHIKEINSIFNRIHFFNYLNNKERNFLMDNTFLFKFKHQETIFQKDQEANSFYLIKSGSIKIQIQGKKDIIMQKDDYFGQSSFLSLMGKTSAKALRLGKAIANQQDTEVFAIGLSSVKKCVGHYIKSIIFFNQEKWALYRDQIIGSIQGVDYNYLLQLFNVKEGRRYTILAKKEFEPKYLYIPLEAEINKSKDLKLYCSEFLLMQNEDKLLNYDIILTEGGYYAYAEVDQFREVLYMNNKLTGSNINLKLEKQPLYMNLTLTLSNVSRYSKQLRSSHFKNVLIVQDMKFGNEFVVKIFKKSKKKTAKSLKSIHFNDINDINDINENTKNPQSFKFLASENSQLQSLSQQVSKNSFIYSTKSADIQTKNCKKLSIQEQLVRRQKNILNSLSNKFVCGYYKCEQDINNIYMFIQYIKGHSLFDVIRDFGIIPENVIKYFMASLVLAIGHLHSNSIVFRDLKPENIIIRNTGQLVLVDFSCAKQITSENRKTNTLIGTPHYMAPEVIKKIPYTFNADIWSLGVILFQMVTGRLPFGNQTDDPIEIFSQIINKPLKISHLTNRNIKNLLDKMLNKVPENRINKAEEIKDSCFLNKLQFKWCQFEEGRLEPFYFPRRINLNYQNIDNLNIFDLETLSEWN